MENHLIVSLRPGDVIVMDNSKVHKVDGVKSLIESVGATLLYLPTYSPDLNPIKQRWSKIKAFFRKIKVRFVDALLNAIPLAFRVVSIADISVGSIALITVLNFCICYSDLIQFIMVT